ncbi:hypothetical protein N7537_000929 [Penicillium hordei]|uniref:GPI anchored protein n=1 Tax=Penicillium hordei TaxID=40994 RepID=A0AAD6EEM1_9EURO|nr:uncharacterized protein N7537_000929 [Penicillium hordei]KAJ5615815.1 hypothetical protein N7537_000929 [Penicillium hordei]
MKGLIGGIPVALLAVAAQARFAERNEHDFHPQAGGTAIGGPSGNNEHGFHPQGGGTAIGGPSGDDNDGGFVSPYSASIKTDTKVDEWSKDDHSIKLKHTDVYPRPPVVPVHFGHPGAEHPQAPGAGPFRKEKRGAPGGTAIGGPSGNDEGQSFDMSVTGVFNTEVEDENTDDHSIDIKNKHVHPPPDFSGGDNPGGFEKRFGPHAGGTAIGGPSGNDGGQSFSAPTNIETDTDVSEHNEDDHSIGLKHEDIYAHPFAPFRRSENLGPGGHPAGHFEPHPESHFEPHPESHFEPHTESHYHPHSEPHYEPHPEPHFENHPEPHTENHPEPHYEPHYSPSYEPHYEPHTTVDHEITSLKNNNNGPSAGSIAFGRRGVPGGHESHFEPHPESHFEPHPESHFEPHSESHYEPHSEPHYEPHPEPHFENHPEPHTENHPEPHYAPHYSPSYEPHYEPHTTLEQEITALKNNNNGPSAGSIAFGRRGIPGGQESHFEPHPESHFEPHPESHFEPHSESHYEPHSEPHYEPHPEPHFENHPEPHTENHPEPHYAPHYSPSYKPHYEPHATFESELTELKNNNNGPAAGSIAFGRRAYAPTPDPSSAGGTGIGGPSGNDGDGAYSTPTDIDASSDVNEHNEDNHAIKGEFTHVHPGGPPEYTREETVEAPQCAVQAHEVVHTVTKTQYHTAEATHVAYESAPAVEHNAIPSDAPHHPAGADAYAPSAPAHSGAATVYPPYSLTTTDGLIPAHVPMATSTPDSSAVYPGWAQPSGEADSSASFPQLSTGADQYGSFPQSSTGADQYGSFPQPSSGAAYGSFPQPSTGSAPYGSFPQPSTGSAPYGSFPQPSTGSAPYGSFPQPSTGADPSGSSQKSVGADPYASFPQSSTGAAPYGSFPQPSSGAASGSYPLYSSGVNSYSASAPAPYDYASQSTSYSKIAVKVPEATPASYGAFSQPTPSNSIGQMIPSGVSAEHKASPSSSASASVSNGVMFEGGAPRLSGGLVSAAVAVMGVLAFIL